MTDTESYSKPINVQAVASRTCMTCTYENSADAIECEMCMLTLGSDQTADEADENVQKKEQTVEDASNAFFQVVDDQPASKSSVPDPKVTEVKVQKPILSIEQHDTFCNPDDPNSDHSRCR